MHFFMSLPSPCFPSCFAIKYLNFPFVFFFFKKISLFSLRRGTCFAPPAIPFARCCTELCNRFHSQTNSYFQNQGFKARNSRRPGSASLPGFRPPQPVENVFFPDSAGVSNADAKKREEPGKGSSRHALFPVLRNFRGDSTGLLFRPFSPDPPSGQPTEPLSR